MPFSYSGNPGASSLDGVRFLTGDTNSKDPLLQDSEINFLVATYTNIFKAAAYAARAIASKFSRLADKSVGDLRIAYSQRQKAYEAMEADYLRQASNRTSIPYAGGLSKNDFENDKLNPDLKQPVFTKHLFEYPQGVPGTGTNTNDIGPADQDS